MPHDLLILATREIQSAADRVLEADRTGDRDGARRRLRTIELLAAETRRVLEGSEASHG